jgi:hypothetical protein
MNLSEENRLLLYCAQTSISEQQRADINDLVARPLDWSRVSDSAYQMGLYPLLYIHIKEVQHCHLVPQEFMNRIKKAYHENTARNMLLYHELKRIIRAFRSAGIDAILLKGAALAKIVYEDIGLRSMSDLDILVKQEDVVHIEEIMSSLNYVSVVGQQEEKWDEKHFHLPQYKHRENNTVVEIHRNITEKSIFLDTDQWWKRARPVTIDGCDAYIPSPEDMLIHLCIHLYNHGYVNNIMLRGLCDINETIVHYKDEVNWNLLRNIINKHGIHKQVNSIFYLVREIYDYNDESLQWIEQYDLDFNFLTILKKRLLVIEDDVYTELSPNLLKFLKVSTFTQKTKMLFQKIFPSRDVISKTYSLPSIRKKIYLYHVLHPFLMLVKHGKFIFSVYRIKTDKEDMR